MKWLLLILVIIVAAQAVEIHSMVVDVMAANHERDSLQVNYDAAIEGWQECLQSANDLKELNRAVSKHDRYLLDVMHDHKKVCPVW